MFTHLHQISIYNVVTCAAIRNLENTAIKTVEHQVNRLFAKFSKWVFLYNPYLTKLFYLVSKDFSWKSFAKQFFGVDQNTLSNFSCRIRQSKHSIQR